MAASGTEPACLYGMSEDREQIARLVAENGQLRAENKLLREKIDLLVRKVFGSSSEKLDPAQMEMLLGELGGKAPATTGGAVEAEKRRSCKRPRRQGRPRLPEHLPVEEEVIEPLEVQANPEKFRRIGQEVSEQLDYRPARYVRRRLVRPKYVSIENRTRPPLIAPLGPQLADKLMATPAMIAHVVVSKYADHLPLYRQEHILLRHQLPISRQTLDGWVMLAADWLRLIYEQLHKQTTEDGYVQIDETPVRYLEPGHGKTKTGYFWTVHRPRGPTVYHWHPSRAARCLQQVLAEDYQGIIQCDGYGAYPAHAQNRPITLAACWAHARRKFFEAKDHDRRMALILKLIGNLYAIERRLRLRKSGPKLRALARQVEARPILARIHFLLTLWKTRRTFLPQSACGQAVDYTLGLWPQLQLFLDDGRLEIDNNGVENAIRPTAIGKKNWLFIGAEGAGQHSAILYTIIRECLRLKLDPQAYLTLALQRLPSATTHTVHTLTPQALAPLLRAQTMPAAQAA